MGKVIYSKCSTERKKEYKILTSILEDNGQRTVRKSAANQKSRMHVNRMLEYYKMGEKYCLPNVKNAPCKQVEDGCVEFDYINGESFAEKMENCVEQDDMELLEKYVTAIRDIIVNVSGIEPFSLSEDFERVFGKQNWLEGVDSAKDLNIDLLAENIIVSDGVNYVIDYELTFPFNIPIKYIVFRMLFFNPTISSLGEEQKAKIYGLCGISKDESDKFYDMEVTFQQYISGNSLDEVKKRIGMNTFLFSQNNEIMSEMTYQLLSDDGAIVAEGSQYGNELKLKADVLNIKEASLKLNYNMCSIKVLSTNAKLISSNEAILVGDDRFYIEKPILKFEVEGKDEIEVDIQVLNENNPLINSISVYANKCKELEASLLKKGDEINGLVEKINSLTNDVLQLGEERTLLVNKIGGLNEQRNEHITQIQRLNDERDCLKNSIVEIQGKFDRYAERSDDMISELGYELSKIKSAKNFEKFAKKNKLYEG